MGQAGVTSARAADRVDTPVMARQQASRLVAGARGLERARPAVEEARGDE